MEREHLIKEIQDLAERIKANASDANLLQTEVAHLYEMVILLKHLPEEVTEEIKIEQKTEVKEEKKVVEPLDLFSAAETPEPAKEKSAEKVTAKVSESVVEKISHKKIEDLKSVIGINEKFQFINELFDGNMKEYTVALDQINNFSSLGEASNYLANLKEMYKWNSENPIASSFEELVQRRFF